MINDGSDKPLGYTTEDGHLQVRQEADGSKIYAETEQGQHDRWLRLAPDLFTRYMELVAERDDFGADLEARVKELEADVREIRNEWEFALEREASLRAELTGWREGAGVVEKKPREESK